MIPKHLTFRLWTFRILGGLFITLSPIMTLFGANTDLITHSWVLVIWAHLMKREAEDDIRDWEDENEDRLE